MFKRKKKPLFIIEYYPITKVYLVRTRYNYYLQTDYTTGIIKELESYLSFYADTLSSEEAAKCLIKKYEEQHFKKNVKYIYVYEEDK